MLSSQVPQGVRRFCPRFYEMAETDKRTFRAYFFQALAGAEAVLNPIRELKVECGVKILVNQIIVQHKPLLTSSGYWSTLRPGGPSYRVFAKQMTNPPNARAPATKSTISKRATTKSVHDDAN